MNTRSFTFGPDIFEPPQLTYEAVMRREEGIPTFGVLDELLDSMFKHFSWNLIDAIARFASALGMH